MTGASWTKWSRKAKGRKNAVGVANQMIANSVFREEVEWKEWKGRMERPSRFCDRTSAKQFNWRSIFNNFDGLLNENSHISAFGLPFGWQAFQLENFKLIRSRWSNSSEKVLQSIEISSIPFERCSPDNCGVHGGWSALSSFIAQNSLIFFRILSPRQHRYTDSYKSLPCDL